MGEACSPKAARHNAPLPADATRLKEVPWRTTRLSSKSGVAGIPRRAIWKKFADRLRLARTLFVLCREVVRVLDRPQDIDNEEAMSFFGGQEGDADQSQG